MSQEYIKELETRNKKLAEMLMNQECLINVLKKENADLKESTIESKLKYSYGNEALGTDQILSNITNILEYHQKQTGTKIMNMTVNWDSITATLRSEEQPFILDIDANINKK